MGKILFLSMPAHGHINPTLGIIDELVKQGEEVTYFSGDEFRDSIENTGAEFKSYGALPVTVSSLRKLQKKPGQSDENANGLLSITAAFVGSCERTVEGILKQIGDTKFDSIGYSSVFPYGGIVASILKIPSFASFAIFATADEMLPLKRRQKLDREFANSSIVEQYRELSSTLNAKYGIEMPALRGLFFNKGDINFAYTSRSFVTHAEDYDDTFKFIGPPLYDREQDVTDFPFNELANKKVIYISLGTVFSSFDKSLYGIFFKAFKDVDAVVVMTAYQTDLSEFDIPENFIVRNYIPQTEVLKYADVAVTHAGMNSTNDLLFNRIPFVAIPLGADQPYMASRAVALGACISLDKDELTPELLRDSINKVSTEPRYLENIDKINETFKECGGHKRAAAEILSLHTSNASK